jgi:hypothetical protein
MVTVAHLVTAERRFLITGLVALDPREERRERAVRIADGNFLHA